MGEEQPRPHLMAEVLQVFVRPGRPHLAIDARPLAVAVPADAEPVAVGHDLGLDGAKDWAISEWAGSATRASRKVGSPW